MSTTTQTSQLSCPANPLTCIKVLMLGDGLDVQGGITSVERLILENTPSDLQVRHVATRTSIYSEKTALYNVKVFLRSVVLLLKALLKNEIDVVHIHFSIKGSTVRKAILAFIAFSLRKPFILHAHGGGYKEFYAGLPQIAQRIIVAIFSRCTQFIALSEDWRLYYSSIFQLKPHQITVLQNPVALPFTIPERHERKQVTFVFLGLFKQDKGAFDLIKAFGALPASDKAVAQLILAGSGDIEGAQYLIEKLSLTKHVQIQAWLDPIQRDQLLMNADVFVLPSYSEALPMSMLEAMAWGLPVIVTPVGAIPEVVTHGRQGLFVQPGNQVEIVQAMQELIRNKKLRISLGTAARHSVQGLNVGDYMNSLRELYISAIRQSRILSKKVQGELRKVSRFNFIGTDVDILTYDELFEKCHAWLRDKQARSRHIACVNVNCAVESYLDKDTRDVFSKADILGADSMPFVYWIRLFTRQKCDRLYAPDIILNLGKIAVKRQYRVFLYGGAEGVPEKMKRSLERKFPGINIVGTYSPPFRSMTPQEDEEICRMINATLPDYILVGLGSPKQDRWIQDHLIQIPGSIMVASGAAFDFFSDQIKQAPLYIQKSGFEWLFRLAQDPKRLWKRYTLYNIIFLWNFLMQILHLKRFKRMDVNQ